MQLPILIFIMIVLMFGVVLIFGAPYVPTLKKRTEEALDILDLKPGQKLLELGSGDGRVLKAAAKRGIYVTGYELNPLLVIISYFVCWRERKYVTIKWANFWSKKLPDADAIFVFLLDRFMSRLDSKLNQELTKPTKLISFAFAINDKKPIREKNALFVYEYKPK
jgi:SAM-dependent methyltransferase